MIIAIFGNIYHNDIGLYLAKTLDYLSNKDSVYFVIENKLADILPDRFLRKVLKFVSHFDDDFEANFAISIGGDGSFLRAAQFVAIKNIPIIGINIGRLGFLAETDTDNMFANFDEILKGNFSIEKRTLLQVSTNSNMQLDSSLALNEVAITKQDESAMLYVATFINGKKVHIYHADGLLISTPTGSTAYSLSLGAPIIVPQTEVFLLTPIAPHSLTVRPMLIPDTWQIDLEISSRNHKFMLSVDGRSIVFNDDVRLSLMKSEHCVSLIKLENHSFFNTLTQKLFWGLDGRTID
jgi:NAD+ kinase